MRRRALLMFAATALLTPLPVFAQEAGRVYRLGVLSGIARDTPQVAAVFDELRRAGFVEGHNLVIAAGGYGLSTDEFSRHAIIIANSAVDAVYAGGDTAIRAAQAAIRTTPIVAITEDMVGAGLVHSLARPGGHTTGVSMLAADLNGKRQEILFEAVPSARLMAALADVNMVAPSQLQSLQESARQRGVDLVTYSVRGFEDIKPAIDSARAAARGSRCAGIAIDQRRQGRSRRKRANEGAEATGDLSMAGLGGRRCSHRISSIRTGVFRQVARMLVRVLRGANPADLPVEQPTNSSW